MVSSAPFITFEGIDGCGKSTQIALLTEWLQSQDIKCRLTREPGGCETAEQIRELVLSPKTNVGDIGELLLYLSARAEHVRQVINPSREKGEWVVCDRFTDSTFAYQGFGRGLDQKKMKLVNDVATDGLTPDVTFLLDIDVKIGKARVVANTAELDRLEQNSLDFFERVRQGFLTRAKEEPTRFIVIDATQPISEIHKQICSFIDSRFLQ